MFRFTNDINMQQNAILPKIVKYLQLMPDISHPHIETITEGYCCGIGSLMAYALWLQFQPKKREKIPRDDWDWLQGVMKLLSKWDGVNLTSFSKEERYEIERFISLIEGFQNVNNYQAISQGNLDKELIDVHGNVPHFVFSVAGCFGENDFTRDIRLDKKNTSLLKLLLEHDGALIFVVSHNHATFLLRNRNNVYYIDANNPRAFNIYSVEDADGIIKAIFKANDYGNKVAPFGLNLFNFSGKVKKFSHHKQLIDALKPALRPESDKIGSYTSLYMAARLGCMTSVKYALKHGANINEKNCEGQTALYLATENHHTELVRYLLKHGANVEIVTNDKESPLHIAALTGHTKAAELLLAHKADANLRNKNQEVPLHYAAEWGRMGVLKLLLKHGAKIDAAEELGATPLVYAIENGYDEFASELLNAGAKTDIKMNDGETLLHVIADNGCMNFAVQLLKNKDVDLNVVNKRGASPLMRAAYNGDIPMVQLLLKHGATPDAVNKKSFAPIFAAAQKGHLDVIELLLKYNVNVNAPTNTLVSSLLSRAKAMDRENELRDLLEKHNLSGDEFPKTIKNFTPLHIAAFMGHVKVVKFLLEHGADLAAKTENGILPYELAKDEKIKKMLEGPILEAHGRKRVKQ